MDTTNRYIPTTKTSSRSIIVILLLLFMYIIGNSKIISNYIDNFAFTYIIKPLLWVCIAIFIYNIPHIKPKAKIKHRKLVIEWATIFGMMFVAINMFAGFIFGLGKSPYSHSIIGIFINIIYVGTALVGKEFIRNYLVNSVTKKENFIVFISISLLMTIINFNINRYIQLKDLETLVQFLAEYFAPEFSNNLFTSYLIYLGGPIPSIIYLGIIKGFHWLSPILPNLKWIITALIGVLCPIFFLMTFQGIYLSTTKKIKLREQEDESPISWIITSMISIGIIWFTVGVFPIYPSVIATGSMEPMISPGDIILVKKIVNMDGINALKEGDVIQFKRGEILISHRIVDVIENDKEGLQFRTKGDNNSTVDTNLVRPQDIKGKVEYTIPKIGWLTLFIKSNQNINLEELIF